MLNKKVAGTPYKLRGWIEEDHCWNECKCLDMTKDLVLYNNIELLNQDLKIFNTTVIDSILESPIIELGLRDKSF